MTMCTDSLSPAEPPVAKNGDEAALSIKNTAIKKRPLIRFSFMGRNVEDLTDDEGNNSDVESVEDSDSDVEQDHAAQSARSLEEEKRIIREQLVLITSQLGKLTGAERAKQQHCPRHKNRRPHTFPDKKEKQKILSIRISLPQDGKNGGQKRTKLSHSSPNTVMSMTTVDSFGLKLNKVRNSDSETDSIASDKQEADPFDALQGIASATPTACNDSKNSKQHNTDSVMSSGVVPAFQLPAWRLAPELDVPQYRLVEDYGEADPHFGPGYNFLKVAWSSEERIGSGIGRKKKKRHEWNKEDVSVEVEYQKSYRNNKRRLLPSGGSSGDLEEGVENTSDEVYRRLHQSQEKAEKERMTSLYNKRLKDCGGKPGQNPGKAPDTRCGEAAAAAGSV